jgi:hypothetical protein
VVRLSDRETIIGAALQKSSTDNATRFIERVLVRCPASLPPAIDRGAAKHLMTASEYIGRSVIDKLRADGIDPGTAVAAQRCSVTDAGHSNGSGDESGSGDCNASA